MQEDYIKSVYAGVLGKVIGVYMGRPFEGWRKKRIEEKWGLVDHYVNEDMNQPLVVPDDDITGTLTFIRALEDSGLYADTTAEFFGEAWLNYIIENKTILWWGGLGVSTEHTAYLRLKEGIKAPSSGSMELNGQAVSEQIGAQIFIDGFGLVCPGKPELAATLAERAARVAHDGEAVYAAKVVAAMISAAFAEKHMDRLLDIGVSMIPADAMIARVHRDIREWSKEDSNWRETFNRIEAKYGYDKFSGYCHVIPNHAIMVMAWCWAPNNFRRSQAIINTAGWDTDCNAANVGCLMGVKLGLERINEDYDFQSPFADRIYLPTSEGTRGVSDVLREAMHLSRIGCKIMDWDIPSSPKDGALFHFSQPGALHGFMPEKMPGDAAECICRNVTSSVNTKERCLEIEISNLSSGICRVSTPLLAETGSSGTYEIMGTSIISPGMKVSIEGRITESSAPLSIKTFIRPDGENTEMIYSNVVSPGTEGSFVLEIVAPDMDRPIKDVGIEISGENKTGGRIAIDAVRVSGYPSMTITASRLLANRNFTGWIKDIDNSHIGFASDSEPVIYLSKNSGTGLLATGTEQWTDYTIEAKIKIHMADRGGILIRYQGLKRYIALVRKGSSIQLIKEYYGTTVLLEKAIDWPLDVPKTLKLNCTGSKITAWLDSELIGTAEVSELTCGGAGFILENGCIGLFHGKID